MFELEKKLVDILNASGKPLDEQFYVVQTILLKLDSAIKTFRAQTEQTKGAKAIDDNGGTDSAN